MRAEKSLLCFGLIFMSAVFVFLPLFAEAVQLTSFTVAPATNNVDNLMNQSGATWRFTISNATALATSTHAVVITFPTISSPWNFSGVTASTTNLATDLLAFATTSVAVVNTNSLVLAVTDSQLSADTDFVIDIKNVTNPSGDLTILNTYAWSVRTCVLVTPGNPSSGCASDLDSANTASATLARRGGLIDEWSYSANNYSAASVSEFTVSFTASTTLGVGEKIWVNFPVGFTVTSATTSNQTIVVGGTAQVSSASITTTTSNGFNAVIVPLTAGTITPASTSTVTLKIGNITNPAKGSYQGFKIFTTTANNGLVDGSLFGVETRNDNRPPTLDGIQVGGTNTIIGQAKVQTATTTRNLTPSEIAQMSINMGCPDKMFFVGTKRLDSLGRFTYSNLLDATYMAGLMPDNTSDPTFFMSYLQPSFMTISVTGGETASATPTFVVPDSYIVGTITGGPANYVSNLDIRAYTSSNQTFSRIYNSSSYTTVGLNSSGTGWFKIPVKSGQTWNFSVQPTSITSGQTQYWAPDVSPVFVESGKSTTTLSAWSFVDASKNLNVTLQDQNGSTITGGGGGPTPCLLLRRAGSEMMGPGGQGVCNTTGGVYQLKVPAGAFVVQIMMPGAGFKEYPVTILSSDTTVNKTIIVSRPTTYITGTVTDPDSFAMQGVSVMAQGSNGSFSQTLTNSSGVYTLYVSTGAYRVEAFAPGYGPLGAQNVTLSGSSVTQNFTINSSSFKTVKGRVYIDANANSSYDAGTDTPQEGVNIHAYGVGGGNGAMTRDDGTYTLTLPSSNGYTIEAWSPTSGFIGTSTANVTSNVTGKNFIMPASGTLRITITDGNTYGMTQIFAGAFSTTTHKGNGSDRWTATSSDADLFTSFSLPAGSYKVDVGTPGFGNLTSLVANYSASSTLITAGATTDLTITLPTMATLSGTAAADATVWASRTDGPGKYNTTANSSGAYSMKIPTGYSYMVGASLPGYINTPVTISSFSANTTQNLTLTLSAYTISGSVSSSGSGSISEGFVWATKSGNNGWTGSEISANGSYSLNIDSGSWTVYANAPCHNQSSGTTQTGSGTVNITLTAISNCGYRPPEMQSIVPSAGGSVATSGIAVNIPANALGTGSTNVSFSVNTPNTVPPTSLNAAPLSGAAKSITVTDSNGTAVSSLSNSIEITLSYSDSDIPAGSSESNLQLAYWNTTTNTWDPVAATLNTENNTLTAMVDHLTDFAPIVPTSESAPSTPAGLAATRSGDAGMSLSWTAVSGATSYLLYRDTTSGGSFPYLTTVTSTTHTDSGLTGNTAYYYKITASNGSGESSASSAVSATTCSSVDGGTVTGSSCTLSCNSGRYLTDGACPVIAGGGGGGGGTAPTIPVQPSVAPTSTPNPSPVPAVVVPVVPTATVVAPSLPTVAVSAVFARGLKIGMTNSDIKRLQQLLNSDPDTTITSSGVGSPGQETNYFGSLTLKAVQKFQMKHGVVASVSDPGYGYVGPMTRAKLQEIFANAGQVQAQVPASQPAEQAMAAQLQLQIQELLKQIETLQAQIKAMQ